jgi:hypothetical protein
MGLRYNRPLENNRKKWIIHVETISVKSIIISANQPRRLK